MKKEEEMKRGPEKELIARSPEAFPKLRFLPSLWFLDEVKAARKDKTEEKKDSPLFKSIPDKTDSY
ncbi:MAG: hypothetical protein MUO76_11345 [Anaerolineaceae bacterium]|nr:hypothetical protein [Anaerolineaceae bacterium]